MSVLSDTLTTLWHMLDHQTKNVRIQIWPPPRKKTNKPKNKTKSWIIGTDSIRDPTGKNQPNLLGVVGGGGGG